MRAAEAAGRAKGAAAASAARGRARARRGRGGSTAEVVHVVEEVAGEGRRAGWRGFEHCEVGDGV
jgi:hypothetical protein